MAQKETYLKRVHYAFQNPAGFGGVEAVYRAARRDGVDIDRKQIRHWLSQQPTYTLHKPIRRQFRRNRVIVGGIYHQWQADLVDMRSLSRSNANYNYLLTCIDMLSKYAWAVPLKNKTGSALIDGFKKILKGGRKPKMLQTDKGTEFLNWQFQSFLKKRNIHFFTTQNETKASVVERFNRTLKTKMYKYFTATNSRAYIKVLPKLISAYNRAYHRSIKIAPASVNNQNAETVWQNLYGDTGTPIKSPTFKFSEGDTVRISMTTRPFRKGYLPSWTTELFSISARIQGQPPVYKLKDYGGEELQGTFYERELQRVIKSDDLYQVEKVLRRRKRRGKTEYFVKWLGYPEKFNSWVTSLRRL